MEVGKTRWSEKDSVIRAFERISPGSEREDHADVLEGKSQA